MSLKAKVTNKYSDWKDLINQGISELGGVDFSKCNSILILPSLTSSNKSEQSAAIVRTEVVEGIINFIKDKYPEMQIMIACGSTNTTTTLFKNLGYVDITKKYSNVTLINLESCEKVKILLPGSKILGAIDFPQPILIADAVITVTTLRRHIHEKFAGIWETAFHIFSNTPLKLKIQAYMSKALFDLNSLVWPNLCIIDAEYALEGTGPIEGRPKHIGKIIISNHPVAADVAAIRLIGESPKQVPHINYAMKQLKIKQRDIHVIGDYFPVKIDFISYYQFRLFRLGLFFRRFSIKLENFGNLLLYLSLALVSVGVKDLATGRWVSLKESIHFARTIYSKIYEMETLFDRKIVINKHVKEQSVS